MIQQKLTKTKMILITKTLVIFPLFTLTSFAANVNGNDYYHYQYEYIYNSFERLSTSGSQAGRARATKPRPCNFRSTGDQTDPKPH